MALQELNIKFTNLLKTNDLGVDKYVFSYINFLTIIIDIEEDFIYKFPKFQCKNLKYLVIQSKNNLDLNELNEINFPHLEELSIISSRRLEILTEFNNLDKLKSLNRLKLIKVKFFNKQKENIILQGPNSLKKLVLQLNSKYEENSKWRIYKPNIISLNLELLEISKVGNFEFESRLIIDNFVNLKKVKVFGHFNNLDFINLKNLKVIKFKDHEPFFIYTLNNRKLKRIEFNLNFTNYFYLIITWINFKIYYLIQLLICPILQKPMSIHKFNHVKEVDIDLITTNIDFSNPLRNEISKDGSFGYNKKRAIFLFIIDIILVYLVLFILKLTS